MEPQYKEYEPEVLKKLQRTQTGILKDFHAICKKYNLSYFLLGGSGIGVVRHQGFIPWDDDIDIAMPRRDYDIALHAIEEEMGEKYRILTPLTNKNYSVNVTKIQKIGTKFVPYHAKDSKCERCIDIDIFPLDNMPDDKKKRSRQLRKTWFLNKLLFLGCSGDPVIPLKGWKIQVAAVICKVTHIVLKVLHVSPPFLYKLLEKEETKYNDRDTEYMNTFRVTMSDRSYISKKEMYPLVEMPFEDMTVYMPHDYDKYLTRLFGDYMTMPPKEKRVNHCPYILDFGDE